jgi:hypothetical protein
MTPIWTGPKVGHPPPSIAELKALTDGIIRELGHTGQRAAALRQKMRPHLYPPYAGAAPVRPSSLTTEEAKEECQQLSEQLGLDLGMLYRRVGVE